MRIWKYACLLHLVEQEKTAKTDLLL
ncbi:uncharacterized protein METZ01_LOCUS46349 [marine metagenome]|uniref:Uncharacterized protein n=1 Tax=marine metagenome TaxID=408172 RepID=A0A381RNN8_9ZZZZ